VHQKQSLVRCGLRQTKMYLIT